MDCSGSRWFPPQVFKDHFPHRNKVLGSWGWIMSLAAALSAFGSLNGTFFSGGRVCFVAAREGHMVRNFSTLN